MDTYTLRRSDASVDLLAVVQLECGDLSLLRQQLAGSSGQRSVDLQPLHKGGGSDQLHLGHLGLQTVPAVLVEKHLGVHLFSQLALVPLLLNHT